MKCKKVKRMLPLFVGAELPPAKISAVKAHIEYCECCRQEYRMYVLSQNTVKDWMQEVEPVWKDSEWLNIVRTAMNKENQPSHSLVPWPFGKIWAYGIMAVFVLFISLLLIQPAFIKEYLGLESFISSQEIGRPHPDLMEGQQQDVISMTMISKETGTKIVWFFDRNFELEEIEMKKRFFLLGLFIVFFLGINHFALSASVVDDIIPFSQQREGPPEVNKEIVKVKYIEVFTAQNILNQYKSRWGKIQALRERSVVIIEDTPEFMDKLLTILKEIDVKPMDLEFKVDLILGSILADPKDEIDKDLNSDPLIKEMRKLLFINSFQRLDSSIIKVQDNSRSQQRMGGKGMGFTLQLNPRYVNENGADSFQVGLSLSQDKGFTADAKQRTVTLLSTKLTLKSGDRSVVGVSKLNGGDKALILILKGTVIK